MSPISGQAGPELALRGAPQRLHPLVLGWEPIPESVSLLGGRPDVFLLEPVTAAAIVYDEGWVLIDTGFNTEIVRDPEQRGSHFNYASYTAVIPPGDPLVDQVGALGLDWADLALCGISHLHCDHGGGLRLLVGGPPIAIQAREYDFAMNRATLRDVYFRSDYSRDGLNWMIVDGDVELAPGLIGLATHGHTPGHMSFSVELPDRRIVLACDAADLQGNITGRVPCGSVAEAGDEDAARRSIERLADLASQPATEVWPGHDPEFWGSRR